MNINSSSFLTVLETTGTLKACTIGESQINLYDFAFQITKRDENHEYGTHRFYDLIMFHNKKCSDFSIGEFKISNMVKAIDNIYKTCSDFRLFTITGITSKTDKFEISLSIPFKYDIFETGTFFIYAILILEQVKDIKKLEQIWDFLINFISLPVSKNLDLISSYHDILSELCQKYPFMHPIISENYTKRIDELHEDLKQLDLEKYKI